MSVIVRPATPFDGPIIAQFNALMAMETEHRVLDHDLLRLGVEAVLKDKSKGQYFLAELNKTVAGQLLITYEWSDWRNGAFWWIQSVYVRQEFRGRGVFKALFKHVEQMAKRQEDVCGLRLYVEHENQKAKEIYGKLGMEKTPYEMFEIDYILR